MSIDDAAAGQCIEIDEGIKGIDDHDEYCSLKIFTRKTLINDKDAYEAYNNYQLSNGFGIHKDGLLKSRTSKNIIRR